MPAGVQTCDAAQMPSKQKQRFTIREVPNPDSPVCAGTDCPPLVPGSPHACDCVDMPPEIQDACALRQVPKPQGVEACAQGEGPRPIDCHTLDTIEGDFGSLLVPIVGEHPDPQGTVVATGQDLRSTPLHIEAAHRACVAFELLDANACPEVPETHAAVATSAECPRGHPVCRNAVHSASMAFQLSDAVSSVTVPQPQRMVGTASESMHSIPLNGNARDGSRMALKALNRLAHLEVPQPCSTIFATTYQDILWHIVECDVCGGLKHSICLSFLHRAGAGLSIETVGGSKRKLRDWLPA
mmetsp:Transcript_64567/g.154263  ORF Transcript_64567/g.154263 Transcript_64567/m.154263 type:complete len:298 (+) Transcript_64567:225-1118(+)